MLFLSAYKLTRTTMRVNFRGDIILIPMTIFYRLRIALLSCCLAIAGVAQAQQPGESVEAKTNQCIGCHQIVGYQTTFPETYPVPKIVGQSAAYIEAALKTYRDGERDHPSMVAIAAQLSEDDIKQIAAFYADGAHDQGAPTHVAAPRGDAARGETLSTSCVACHGVAGNKPIAAYPKLAGQHEKYLLYSLRAYKNGHRGQGAGGIMAAQLVPLSDSDDANLNVQLSTINNQDLADLAAYFSSQEGDIH